MRNKLILRIKKPSIERITIQFVIIMGLLIGYIEHDFVWNIALMFLMILSMLNSKTFIHQIINYKENTIAFLLIIFIIVLNVFSTGQINYVFYRNMVEYSKLLFTLAIFLGYSRNRDKELNKIMLYDYWLFNIFWIINLVVVGIQITGSGFLIKDSWKELNSFYPDLCAGLFGNNGTHILAMFSVFILIYNQVFALVANISELRRKQILIYTYVTEGVMLVFSTQNDNFFLYFLTICFEAAFFLTKAKLSGKSVSSRLKKIMKYVFIIVVLIIVVYNIPQVKDYFDKLLVSRFTRLIKIRGDVHGGNERLAIVSYAFERGQAWVFGFGLGASTWAKGELFGFNHFGLSSIGSFVALGGIWFYILNCILFGLTLAKCYTKSLKINSISIWTILLAIALSVYTRFFTVVPSLIWVGMILFAFSIMKDYYSDKKTMAGLTVSRLKG